MTDEKKKGKALNALKKKFNTGGRVNARRGGRRNNLSFSKEDLNTAQAKEFFRSTSKTVEPKKPTQAVLGTGSVGTKVADASPPFSPKEQMGSNRVAPKDLPSPKKSTQTAKTSAPKKPTGFQQMDAGTQTPAGAALETPVAEQLRPDAGIRGTGAKTDKSFDASKATTEQLKALKKLQENAQSVTASQEYQGLLEEYERTKGDPKITAQLQQKLAPFQAQQAAIMGTQSPRGAANIQQAQNAGQAVMAQSAGAGTDFNIDVDLSGMPQRGDYGRGREGNQAYQEALRAWQASKSGTGGGGDDAKDTTKDADQIEEEREELRQTQENYVAPKAEVVKAGQAIDHNAIIQDAMNRQPLFGNPPQKMMDYSYDKESGEYVIDNAGWGFEGDARFTRLSPEEFYDKMGINPNKFIGDDPSLSTSEEDIQKLKTGEDRVGIDDPTDVTAGTTTVEQGTAKTAADVEYGVPKGYSLTPNPDVGSGFDHDAIIQDAMNRQPLFGGEKKMDYSYDKESGEYVIDNAGWGFEGDARFRRLSPQEFYDKMGINPNKFMGDDPSLSTSEEDIQKLKTGEERVGIDDPTDVTAGTTTVEQGTAKTAADVEYGVPKGYSLTPNPDVGSGFDTAVMPSAGKVFAYNQETGQRIEIDEPGAKTITADAISDEDRTRAEAATWYF